MAEIEIGRAGQSCESQDDHSGQNVTGPPAERGPHPPAIVRQPVEQPVGDGRQAPAAVPPALSTHLEPEELVPFSELFLPAHDQGQPVPGPGGLSMNGFSASQLRSDLPHLAGVHFSLAAARRLPCSRERSGLAAGGQRDRGGAAAKHRPRYREAAPAKTLSVGFCRLPEPTRAYEIHFRRKLDGVRLSA